MNCEKNIIYININNIYIIKCIGISDVSFYSTICINPDLALLKCDNAVLIEVIDIKKKISKSNSIYLNKKFNIGDVLNFKKLEEQDIILYKYKTFIRAYIDNYNRIYNIIYYFKYNGAITGIDYEGIEFKSPNNNITYDFISNIDFKTLEDKPIKISHSYNNIIYKFINSFNDFFCIYFFNIESKEKNYFSFSIKKSIIKIKKYEKNIRYTLYCKNKEFHKMKIKIKENNYTYKNIYIIDNEEKNEIQKNDTKKIITYYYKKSNKFPKVSKKIYTMYKKFLKFNELQLKYIKKKITIALEKILLKE